MIQSEGAPFQFMVVERVLVESRKSEFFGEIIKLMMTQMWLLNIFLL